MTRVLSILFVCKGNICRSPTAEEVMLHRIRALGLGDRFLIDSAGTRDWFDGKPPHPPTVVAAGKRGYDLSGLRGRGVVVEDFERVLDLVERGVHVLVSRVQVSGT